MQRTQSRWFAIGLAAILFGSVMTGGRADAAVGGGTDADSCAQIAEFGVAGSGEPGAPDGAPGTTADAALTAFESQLPPNVTTQRIPVPYTAIGVIPGIIGSAINGIDYTASRDEGISVLLSKLRARVNACPQQRFVLAGLSQGADVIATTIQNLDPSVAIDRAIANRIAAVSLFGDPLFNPADSGVDTGSFDPTLPGILTGASVFPAPQAYGVRTPFETNMSTHINSYCRSGDFICNAGFEGAVRCVGPEVANLLLLGQATALSLLPKCPHVLYASGDNPFTTRAGTWMATRTERSLLQPLITDVVLPDATTGVPYNTWLHAVDGSAPYTWHVVDGRPALPPGLRLSTDGLLSGIPTTEGTTYFTVRVVDAQGKGSNASFSLTRAPSTPLSASFDNSTQASVGTSFIGGVGISGGIQPYKVTLKSGSLPDGLTLAIGGSISGTPTQVQTSSFVLKVKDAAGTVVNVPGSIHVNAAQSPMTTIAGTVAAGYSGDGGPAIDAQLNYAFGLASAPDGSLYFSDQFNNVIRRIDTNGNISTVAGTGQASSYLCEAGSALSVDLYYPGALAVGPDGSVYFGCASGALMKLSTDGMLTVLATTYVDGVVVDANNNVYVSNFSTNRVYKVTPDGTVSLFAGNGTNIPEPANGTPAVDAAMSAPAMLALDNTGHVLIASRGFEGVFRVESDNTITKVIGFTEGFPVPSNQLSGIAVGPDNSLYLGDERDCTISRLSPQGELTTIAGQSGVCGTDGDGGPTTSAMLADPLGMTVVNGSLYVADINRIRKINLG